MGSTATPMGLRPISRHGAGGQEVFSQYPIASGYATDIACGDIVQWVDGGTATTIEKQSATGDITTEINIAGIFLGVSYTEPNSGQLWFSTLWPASTVASDAVAFVVDNPNVEFAIQADGSFANANDIYNKNFALVQTAPNTTFKISRVALDASSLSNDAQLPIRCLDYLGGPLGDETGTSFPWMRCKFNYHQTNTAAGV